VLPPGDRAATPCFIVLQPWRKVQQQLLMSSGGSMPSKVAASAAGANADQRKEPPRAAKKRGRPSRKETAAAAAAAAAAAVTAASKPAAATTPGMGGTIAPRVHWDDGAPARATVPGWAAPRDPTTLVATATAGTVAGGPSAPPGAMRRMGAMPTMMAGPTGPSWAWATGAPVAAPGGALAPIATTTMGVPPGATMAGAAPHAVM
jgi:hypothetical protein